MTYREPALVPAAPAHRSPIVAGAERLFPRQHPSADLSIGLALLSFLGLGPVAGIPACLLSRLVLNEVAAAPRLYAGRERALGAFVGGWTGSLLWSGIGLGLLGRGFAPVAYAALVVGALAAGVGVPAVLVLFKRPRPLHGVRNLATAVGTVGGTLFLSGAGGALLHAADVRDAAAQCEELRRKAGNEITAARFDVARQHLHGALEKCEGSPLREAQALWARLPDLEQEERKRQASQRFELTRRTAVAAVADANTLAAKKNFEKADAKLRKASEQLDEFRKWPHVANTPAFQKAADEVRDARQRIAPQADASVRRRVAALLMAARRYVAERKWDLALMKLAEVDTARKEWVPPFSTAVEWSKLETDIAKEKERANAGAAAERRKREAAAEVAQKREEARQRAAEATEAAASRSLRCCDGTLSPSCLCGGSRRGCCSHHGGVCGCE